MVLRLPVSLSNWNLEMLFLLGEGKTGVPGEKPLRARERTNNNLNPHMTSTPGFELGMMASFYYTITTILYVFSFIIEIRLSQRGLNNKSPNLHKKTKF